MIISKIPSLRAFPQDSSLNLLPIYYLRIEEVPLLPYMERPADT